MRMAQSSMYLVEYVNVNRFQEQVGSWMMRNEIENCHVLAVLEELISSQYQTAVPKARYLRLAEEDRFAIGAILRHTGDLVICRLPSGSEYDLVEGLLRTRCSLNSVYGPAVSAWRFAQVWSERTGQHCKLDRTERIYHLEQPVNPPALGCLEIAAPADRDFLKAWFDDFASETEINHDDIDDVREALVSHGQLYIWKCPEPVAMAAWIPMTATTSAIDFVYTSPLHRRKGFATTVVAALTHQVLEAGQRVCIFRTGPANPGIHIVFDRVGALPRHELLRCRFTSMQNAVENVGGGVAALHVRDMTD